MHPPNPKAKPHIVAVCATNPTLIHWFGVHPGPIQTTTVYKALLANPEVDSACCAVPHAQMYPDILNAGKHLFGEKPFGMYLAQIRTIMAALDAHLEPITRCGSGIAFCPGAQKVTDFVKSGAVGEFLEVEASFLHSPDIDLDKLTNWNLMMDENGEHGCMGDLRVHVLYVSLRLGWHPDTGQASLVTSVTQRSDGKGNLAP